MTTIYQLKPAFQALLRPQVNRLARLGLSPNQLTLAALALAALSGACIALTRGAPWSLALLPPALLARMALNAMDGMLAREHGMATRAGAMLNEMGDVLADALMYLPLALVPGMNPALVTLFVLTGILAEMAGLLAALSRGTRRYDGPMGKSDRAAAAGLVALFLALGAGPGAWTDAIFITGAALGLLSAWRRCKGGLEQ